METRFFHSSKNPITEVYDVPEEKKSFNFEVVKPNGLWFGKNDEWDELIKHTNSELFKYTYKYELVINFDNFLIIDDIDKLYDLIDKYWINSQMSIDWAKVSQEYDGIYFDNYFDICKPIKWNSNRQTNWFITLDASSGCIFKARCVRSISEIPI